MDSIAGYRAALMAACALPRMYPLLITAAGTVVPARVFIIGAGVVGIPNPLFAADNTRMFFGDTQKCVQNLITAYREA
jgi:NAD/NADP transhydrogenase alpha subunit